MGLVIDNAICWAQFRLRGGWRGLFSTAAAYAAIVCAVLVLFYQLMPTRHDRSDMLDASSTILMVVQTGMLLMLAAMSVSGAIRRDINGRQIESHRLMPVQPVTAVLGYIAGSAGRFFLLFIINLIIGVVLVDMRGVQPDGWIAANAVLLAFGLMAWTVAALSAFVSRWVFWMAVAVCASILPSAGNVFTLAPGLLLICSPMQASTIFGYSHYEPVSNGLLVGLAAQLVVMLLCIRACARKYHRDDLPALSLGLALFALLTWVGVSYFAIEQFPSLRPTMMRFGQYDWQTTISGSIIVSTLVATLSLAPLAWEARANSLARQRRSGVNSLLKVLSVITLCVAAILSLTRCHPGYDPNPLNWWMGMASATTVEVIHPHISIAMRGLVAAAVAIALMQVYLLMLALYGRMRRANLGIALLLGLIWWLPVMADLIYCELTLSTASSPKFDRFSLASPFGTVFHAFDPVPNLGLGVLAQFAVLAMVAILVWQTRSRRSPKRRPIPVNPLAALASEIAPANDAAVGAVGLPLAPDQ